MICTNDTFYNQLNEDSDEDDNEEMEGTCLISGMPLIENSVELSCGHKYNYFELYNEVYNQKKKKISSYGMYRLRPYQIMCPYCRHIENSLMPLPYRLPSGVEKIHGVNFPLKHTQMKNECKFVMKSGGRKGEECGRLCINEYCYFHEGYLYKKSLKNDLSNKCAAILKTGKNKGKQCTRTACIGDKCKIHSK